MTYYKHKL